MKMVFGFTCACTYILCHFLLLLCIGHHQMRVSSHYRSSRTTFQWLLTAEILAGEKDGVCVCVCVCVCVYIYASLWVIVCDLVCGFCSRFPEDSLYLSEETWRMIRIGEGPLGFGRSRSLSLSLPAHTHVDTHSQ